MDDLLFNTGILDTLKPKNAKDCKTSILSAIANFEKRLDEKQEVVLKLASFGQSITLSVMAIGSEEPFILHFYGEVDGKPAQLIQHINQLNFLIIAVEKPDLSKPTRRIGFHTD